MRMNMPAARSTAAQPAIKRRNFLYATTAVVGAAGLAAVAWPFIAQMLPDARVRAAGDFLDLDIGDMQDGEQRVVHWHMRPIFVVKRTPAMLAAMQAPDFVAK